MCWTEHNCERCKKGPDPDIQGPNEKCDIENAFALASICAGKLVDPVIGDEAHAASLAARLGWNGVGSIPWTCPEFEANARAHEHHDAEIPSQQKP